MEFPLGVNNTQVDKYVSCPYLEYGLVALSGGLRHCCGDFTGVVNFDVEPVIEYSDEMLKDSNQLVSRFIDCKKQTINDIIMGRKNGCTGCPNLVEGYWPREKRIMQISLAIDTICNLQCSYCVKQKPHKMLDNSDRVLLLLKKLEESSKVQVEYPLFFGSGEICVQPNVDALLECLSKYNVVFFSNATRYHAKLHSIIKKPLNSIIVSLDSGTRETYKRIKGADLFEQTCETIGMYASDGGNITLKYVLTEDNLDKRDLEGFLDLCIRHKIRQIRVDRDWQMPVSKTIRNTAIRLAYMGKKNGVICHTTGITTCE